VKQLDEAVLGEDGIMVKLAEAEARMAQAIKSRCRVEARLEKMQVCYLRRTIMEGGARENTCILPQTVCE
jgi:hypothetical protein